MARIVTIDPFFDAAGNHVSGEVSFVFVDVNGEPILAFSGLGTIVKGHKVVVGVDSSGESIDLEPNADLVPDGFWSVTVKNDKRCFPGVLCTLIDGPNPITLRELLGYDAADVAYLPFHLADGSSVSITSSSAAVPFYLADGSRGDIQITNSEMPFYLADGNLSPIPMSA